MEIHTECAVGGTIYHCYCKWAVPRLFRYADNGQWNKIPKRCQRRPREVKFRHKYAPADTALHRLMRPLNYCTMPERNLPEQSSAYLEDDDHVSDVLLEAVQAIIATHPLAMTTLDMFGRSPLHMGCLHELTPARTRVLLWLLEHCGDTDVIRAADTIHGRTILHHVAAARDTSDGVFRRKLTRAILNVDPHAMQRIDKDGNRPDIREKDVSLKETNADNNMC